MDDKLKRILIQQTLFYHNMTMDNPIYSHIKRFTTMIECSELCYITGLFPNKPDEVLFGNLERRDGSWFFNLHFENGKEMFKRYPIKVSHFIFEYNFATHTRYWTITRKKDNDS